MAVDRSVPSQTGDTVGSMSSIELNGVIYSPMTTVNAFRVEASRVSKYNDEDLRQLPDFKYRNLQSMRRTIRLLRLLGGGKSNPEISCELFEVQFDQNNVARDVGSSSRRRVVHGNDAHVERKAVTYEALSWCWGTESKDCGIRITTANTRSCRLAVSRELILALKYLRRPNEDRVLWIDALCINQANHEERNHQVQMMSRIYSCSKQVCVWLGRDDDDSAMAISFIREIMELENFDAISEKKENAHKWRSLLLLMQRPWFSRRWVVQEIALARTATIYCGNDQIPWEQFAVAVELFVEVETATHRLSEVMRKDEKFNHVPQWFEHVSELGASVLVQATGKVFRQDGSQVQRDAQDAQAPSRKAKPRTLKSSSKLQKPTGKTEEAYRPPRPLLSLEYLVSSLSVFEASQPRDVIYSLLTISRDTSPFAELRSNSQDGSEEATIMSTVSSFLERKPFKVDYSRPISDVCKDFISFCIHGAKGTDPTRALDILCRPWAPDILKAVSIVVHKKPRPYKYSSERKTLWEKSGKPRKREVNGVWENDNRTIAQYWVDVEQMENHNRKKEFEDFKARVNRFLPKKATGTPNIPEKDEEDDVESEPDQSVPEEEEEDIDLPSWVSPVSGAPFALYHHPGMHSMKRMGRKNADPLVGLPQDGHRNYSAAQNKKADYVKFRKRPILGHYSLYTKGFILEKVTEVAEPARLGSIPETWTELAGWKRAVDGDTEPPAVFWRTLVADRGRENRNPPYYYATACKESVKKGGLRGGSVDTAALINSERNSIVAEFCRRVQAVIWNRCLIKTESNTLGLASQKVRRGDLVCIIFGCTVPVILRQSAPKTEEQIGGEKMQDSFEAMKAAVSLCEDACFRKLRYKRKLEELAQKGESHRDDWKDEVAEELDVVNKQLAEWKSREKMDEEQRKEDDETKKRRKNDATKRRKLRKQKNDHVKKVDVSPISSKRATTFPTPRIPQFDSGVGIDASDGVTSTAGPEPLQDTEPTRPEPNGESKENADEADEFDKRKEEAEKQDPTLYYTLVGEAYIHGYMDGEAVRKQFLEGIPERMFEIR